MLNLAQIGNSQEKQVRWYKAKTCAIFVPWPPLQQPIYPEEIYFWKYIFRQNVLYFLTNVLSLTEIFRNPKFLEILEWFFDCILEI